MPLIVTCTPAHKMPMTTIMDLACRSSRMSWALPCYSQSNGSRTMLIVASTGSCGVKPELSIIRSYGMAVWTSSSLSVEGVVSCATCHVYLDETAMSRFPSTNEDDSDLLESSNHRMSVSRLSCQLAYEAEHSGLTITISPEDWLFSAEL